MLNRLFFRIPFCLDKMLTFNGFERWSLFIIWEYTTDSLKKQIFVFFSNFISFKLFSQKYFSKNMKYQILKYITFIWREIQIICTIPKLLALCPVNFYISFQPFAFLLYLSVIIHIVFIIEWIQRSHKVRFKNK